VLEVNAKVNEIILTKRLIDRMNEGQETIADLRQDADHWRKTSHDHRTTASG